MPCSVGPGWKPSAAMLKAGTAGRSSQNPFASQWTPIPLRIQNRHPQQQQQQSQQDGSGVVSVAADLTALQGRKPLAVRLAWPMFSDRSGFGSDDMCCVNAATQVRPVLNTYLESYLCQMELIVEDIYLLSLVHSCYSQRDESQAPRPGPPGPVGGIAPCVPGNCPLYSSISELPANPFFATISEAGKCACTPPQTCDA